MAGIIELLHEGIVSTTRLFIQFLVIGVLSRSILKKEGNGWKIRFRGWRNGGLNPYIKSKLAIGIVFVVVVLVPPLIEILFKGQLDSFLRGTGWKIILIFLASASFSVLFITKAVLDYKNVPIISFSVFIGVVPVILFIILSFYMI